MVTNSISLFKKIIFISLVITIIQGLIGYIGINFVDTTKNIEENRNFLATFAGIVGYLKILFFIFILSFFTITMSKLKETKLKKYIINPYTFKNIITTLLGLIGMITILYTCILLTPEVVENFENKAKYVLIQNQESFNQEEIKNLESEIQRSEEKINNSIIKIVTIYIFGFVSFILFTSLLFKKILLNISESTISLKEYIKKETKIKNLFKNFFILLFSLLSLSLIMDIFIRANSLTFDNVYLYIFFENISYCIYACLINYLYFSKDKKTEELNEH